MLFVHVQQDVIFHSQQRCFCAILSDWQDKDCSCKCDYEFGYRRLTLSASKQMVSY